jgi:hypothetical protein
MKEDEMDEACSKNGDMRNAYKKCRLKPKGGCPRRRWQDTRLYPKVSGLVAWSENCK